MLTKKGDWSNQIPFLHSTKLLIMIPSARSVYYFAFYLYLVGLALILVPNVVLQIFQLPTTQEVWIRVAGVLTFNIGFYYHRNAIINNVSFLRTTIPTRILVFIAFTAFALLQYVSPVIIIFGAVDLLGAIWTWRALKKL
jgi:hypothetical protein